MSNRGARVSIVAVDTGGTFTDVVCLLDGAVEVVKVASTPEDPAQAVLEGVRRVLGWESGEFILIHGSTVATNALLERRGARVALVTNRGFEDVIEIGRQNRPQLYALVGTRPAPLVVREARIGITGRLGPKGEEIEALDEKELARLADRLGGAEAVAICLLHSYADASHERRVAAALERLGKRVSVSSELLPEFREYERTATTVVNAYVSPIMDRYLARLEDESGARRVRVMGSGGGAIPVGRARREAVHTILSGPAGGVIGALAVARTAGIERILTFDMGGTSTDVSLCPGDPLHTREFTIAGVPVAIPVLDIHTVGAGGGSIARVDAGGALRVGPESAGAVPGPICYGRGGRAVTVTDAHVWLGRLPPSGWRHVLSGTTDAAPVLNRSAIAEPLRALANALGTDEASAAEGVIAVIDAAMEGALRVISVERGYDPAEFTLVCFGGAAGLHAAALAARMGVPRVLVPPVPGALSAFGMLVAPVRKDASRTVLLSARDAAEAELEPHFAELEAVALAGMAEEGLSATDVALHRRVDARYLGQSYELTVPAFNWVEAFHAAHESRYGYGRRGSVVQAVTLRVEALAESLDARFPALSDASAGPPEPVAVVEVVHDGMPIAARHYSRAALLAGHSLVGPAIISEYTATLWVPPGWSVLARSDASLLLEPVGVEGTVRGELPLWADVRA
jgi:N-methylhydantoinase A